jgi:hypothetical protein
MLTGKAGPPLFTVSIDFALSHSSRLPVLQAGKSLHLPHTTLTTHFLTSWNIQASTFLNIKTLLV